MYATRGTFPTCGAIHIHQLSNRCRFWDPEESAIFREWPVSRRQDHWPITSESNASTQPTRSREPGNSLVIPQSRTSGCLPITGPKPGPSFPEASTSSRALLLNATRQSATSLGRANWVPWSRMQAIPNPQKKLLSRFSRLWTVPLPHPERPSQEPC